VKNISLKGNRFGFAVWRGFFANCWGFQVGEEAFQVGEPLALTRVGALQRCPTDTLAIASGPPQAQDIGFVV
jgi:hypothetical protein